MATKKQEYLDILLPLTKKYIEANSTNNGYEKSNLHFEISKILCEYAVGKENMGEYYSGLKLHIHKITTDVTERLEDIGVPITRGYIPATILPESLQRHATKLALKLMERIDADSTDGYIQLINNDINVHKLKTPTKRLIGVNI